MLTIRCLTKTAFENRRFPCLSKNRAWFNKPFPLDNKRVLLMTDSSGLRLALSSTLPSPPDEVLDELMPCFVPRQVERTQVLLRAGTIWRDAIFIEQGLLRMSYIDKKGREFNKGFFSEGQWAWPIAPSARAQPSLFSIEALESCTLWVADLAQLRQMLKSRHLWESFALPFAEWLADQKFLREYEFLIDPARDRYRRFSRESPELVNRIPDYHLASYLGMTNVTFSRIKRSER